MYKKNIPSVHGSKYTHAEDVGFEIFVKDFLTSMPKCRKFSGKIK